MRAGTGFARCEVQSRNSSRRQLRRLLELKLPFWTCYRGEHVQPIEAREDLLNLATECRRGEAARVGQKHFPHDPGLERQPVFLRPRQSGMLRPPALLLAMPVGLVACLPNDAIEQILKYLRMGLQSLAKNGVERSFHSALPRRVESKAHSQALRVESNVETAVGLRLAPAVENIEVVIGLIGALVLAEANITINA